MAKGLFEQLSSGMELVVSGTGWLTADCGGQEPVACPVPGLMPWAGLHYGFSPCSYLQLTLRGFLDAREWSGTVCAPAQASLPLLH